MEAMSKPSLSVVIPAYNEEGAIAETLQSVSAYFRSTGLRYEVLVVDDGSTDRTREVVTDHARSDPWVMLLQLPQNRGKGAAVRRGVQEAQGDVICFIDADLPYRLQNLGDAIALVQSGVTDIAIGARDLRESESDQSYPWLRKFMGKGFSLMVRAFLVPAIPDTQCGMKAFSAEAAKLLFSESKLNGFGFDFEVLFLANKYGFRFERLPVVMTHRHGSKVNLFTDSLQMLSDLFRVRWLDRRMAYRAPRRCPVCFSASVWSRAQIRTHVVRECSRCKCRYLAQFPDEESLRALYNSDYFESGQALDHGYDTAQSDRAVKKTNDRRLALLRKLVPAQARVLEVGAGTGRFGKAMSGEFEYVGIDLSDDAARRARAEGLEVYCASLFDFVNTGSGFDAVTLFHVFEHLSDPHDALARIKDLLKPGGALVLITPDTESWLCAVSGHRWVSYKFPEHLILYSRSALIELLEHSGFEIITAQSDHEYCEHEFLLTRLEQLSPLAAAAARVVLSILPSPLPVSSGSIRIVARRRAGSLLNMRTIRTVEATHAR